MIARRSAACLTLAPALHSTGEYKATSDGDRTHPEWLMKSLGYPQMGAGAATEGSKGKEKLAGHPGSKGQAFSDPKGYSAGKIPFPIS